MNVVISAQVLLSSKRKTTSSPNPKRKTISSSSPKQKLKWLDAKEYFTKFNKLKKQYSDFDNMEHYDLINMKKSNINLLEKYKDNLPLFLKSFELDKILYMNHRHDYKEHRYEYAIFANEYTIVAKLKDRTYLYWETIFLSGLYNSYSIHEIQINIYQDKSWISLYESMPMYLKTSIKNGNHGNIINKKIANDNFKIKWTHFPIAPLKKMVKEWFALDLVKESFSQNYIKSEQKKQFLVLTNVVKIAAFSFIIGPGFSQLYFLAKLKNKAYAYFYNFGVTGHKNIHSTIQTESFDDWKIFWSKVPHEIREKFDGGVF